METTAKPSAPEAPIRIPIEPGFFTIPEQLGDSPRLLGSRCDGCGEVFFPRRVVCAKCLATSLADCELGPRGRLYTFTWVHVPMFGGGRSDANGYGVGQIDLDEGPRVQSVLSGERDEFSIGMALELGLETLRRTEAGEDVVIFRFAPAQADA